MTCHPPAHASRENGTGRPTEIKGIAALANDALDDVRIDDVRDVVNRMAEVAIAAAAIGIQHRGDRINGRGRNVWLVPAH